MLGERVEGLPVHPRHDDVVLVTAHGDHKEARGAMARHFQLHDSYGTRIHGAVVLVDMEHVVGLLVQADEEISMSGTIFAYYPSADDGALLLCPGTIGVGGCGIAHCIVDAAIVIGRIEEVIDPIPFHHRWPLHDRYRRAGRRVLPSLRAVDTLLERLRPDAAGGPVEFGHPQAEPSIGRISVWRKGPVKEVEAAKAVCSLAV